MTLLPALILAAGLAAGTPAAPPASFAQQAELRLNRLAAATTPALLQRAVRRALAADQRQFHADLARRLADARSGPPAGRALAAARHARRAKTRLDRMVTANARAVRREAVRRAVSADTRRLGTDIARELARTRVTPVRRPVARLPSPPRGQERASATQ